MVLGELTFRDLDRKWFLLENKKEIKRINRLFHYKKSKYYEKVGFACRKKKKKAEIGGKTVTEIQYIMASDCE